MGVLATFGDSFTYGDELEGSRTTPPSHEHLTFTYELARQLGVSYYNFGANGSSNQKIFRKFLNYLHTQTSRTDYIVITWSSWGRLEVCEDFILESDQSINIDRERDMNQIIPSHKSSKFILDTKSEEYPERKQAIIDWYDKVYTMQTAILHHLDYMKHAQWLCDTLDINIIQGIIHPGMWSNVLHTMKMDGYEDYKSHVRSTLEYLRPECKVGLGEYHTMYEIAESKYSLYPNGHPDERSHKEYADLLFDIFEEKYKCY